MHLGLEELADFFDAHRRDEALVLATVVATEGSTYRKPGALLLAAPDGSHAGLISGGCLEGDLLQHAAPVFGDGRARHVSYDLDDDPELLMGLGLGCGGAIHLLLRRLTSDDGLDAMALLFDAHRSGQDAELALVSEAGVLPEGALAVRDQQGRTAGHEVLRALLDRPRDAGDRSHRWRRVTAVVDGQNVSVQLLWLAAAPLVLVCGAGPDAVPLASQVRGLGWRCTVTDHRAVFARAERFAAGTRVLQVRPEHLAEALDLDTVDAAVVMTHHLGHDEACLGALLPHAPTYLGLLGPARRRRELAARLGVDPDRIRGPAGLDLGAELPASIALSLMAEIHAVLNGRDGRPLGFDD